MLRAEAPRSEGPNRGVAPSVVAEGRHAGCAERLTHLPTIDVLRGLCKQGFEPFVVAQGQRSVEGKAEWVKHMIQVRHVRDDSVRVGTEAEANAIILINSHDGAHSHQMLADLDLTRQALSQVFPDLAAPNESAPRLFDPRSLRLWL